jgi:RHS repeat-associated protein
VELDGVTYVERIAYTAKGQRALIAYGNGVMTCYAYDPCTFRMARLRTERFTKPDALTCRPAGSPLQDFAYEYDLVGNITAIHDRAPGSGVLNTMLGPDALDRKFTYDPLYRLLSATGRECDLPPAPPPWEDQPRCTDLTRTRAYTEEYHYDKVGNLLQLRHAANGDSFTRELTLVTNGNGLASMTMGQTAVNYTYDTNGNLIREGDSRHFEWDHSNQMKTFRTQVGKSEPSVHAHYLYDAGGQRVKKLVRKQGGSFETTTYIDGLFEHHRWQNNGQPAEQNNHLHVMDDRQRIALVRVGTPHPDDRGPAVQFHLGDHLGSSNLVINKDGSFINREEHTPYGETSFGSFSKKRYRFTGKERDEETGLYYHGARYYAPWLARWVSCDPAGNVDGLNLYRYPRNNPMVFIDPKGSQGESRVDPTSNHNAGASNVKRAANQKLKRESSNHSAGVSNVKRAANQKIINQELKREFSRTKYIISEIGRTAKFIVPSIGIIDPFDILRAEKNVAYEQHKSFTSMARIFDYYWRQEELLRKETGYDLVHWAKEELQKEDREQKAIVSRLHTRLDTLRVELSVLTESDARTPEEKRAGEPPHPPWSRINALKEEIKSLEEEISVETRISKDLSKDLEKFNGWAEKEKERQEKVFREDLKSLGKRLLPR